MCQTNASRFTQKIFTIFVLELLGNQFQLSHFAFVEGPGGCHNKATMNCRNIVPFLFSGALRCELGDGRHLKRIRLKAICKMQNDKYNQNWPKIYSK